MRRPKLRSSDQPWPIRYVLGIYEFCASLKLAVVMISLVAIVLGMATFYERKFGLNAVHFGIYGSWWFAALLGMLGVNIFCAAAIRYPWQRYQTGFVITHIGLLTLLTGCFISWLRGVDAQMLIHEGGTGHEAFEDATYFQMIVDRTSHDHAHDANHTHEEHGDLELLRPIPFAAGPFNWKDYGELPRFPWRLASRDGGVLFDEDGIRLEVLDYYSNSEPVEAPALKIELSVPQVGETQSANAPATWVPLGELRVRGSSNPRGGSLPFGIGQSRRIGGGQVSFWLSSGPEETAAFLASAPRGELGEKGQVVLSVGGERFQFLVDERLGTDRFPLGETGLEVELIEQTLLPDDPSPHRAVIDLRLHHDGETTPMTLFAGNPELNRQDYDHGVYGTYWVGQEDASSEELIRGQGGSRIDIIQGQDEKLYYRNWNRREVIAAEELPKGGEAIDSFRMPIGTLKMRVVRHVASEKPAMKILPLGFHRDTSPVDAFRAAKLRMTVDENTEEFWLLGTPPMLFQDARSPLEQRTVAGEGRTVSLSMPLVKENVGFRIRLRPEGFERKLDPGTSQASHFGSRVDFIDLEDDSDVLREDVQISMNAPVDFTDPNGGRSYRLFQEAYRGPFMAGTGEYAAIARQLAEPPDRDQLFITILTVNYDPGRWVKYLGCLLITAGIVTMFYMRAYFFKPRALEQDDDDLASNEESAERRTVVAHR